MTPFSRALPEPKRGTRTREVGIKAHSIRRCRAEENHQRQRRGFNRQRCRCRARVREVKVSAQRRVDVQTVPVGGEQKGCWHVRLRRCTELGQALIGCYAETPSAVLTPAVQTAAALVHSVKPLAKAKKALARRALQAEADFAPAHLVARAHDNLLEVLLWLRQKLVEIACQRLGHLQAVAAQRSACIPIAQVQVGAQVRRREIRQPLLIQQGGCSGRKMPAQWALGRLGYECACGREELCIKSEDAAVHLKRADAEAEEGAV